MQSVDILRDDSNIAVFCFEPSERNVRGVRLNAPMSASSRIIEVEHTHWIALETFRCRDLAPIVFGPNAIWIAERRHAAFGR